jgi:hypothetical protein
MGGSLHQQSWGMPGYPYLQQFSGPEGAQLQPDSFIASVHSLRCPTPFAYHCPMSIVTPLSFFSFCKTLVFNPSLLHLDCTSPERNSPVPLLDSLLNINSRRVEWSIGFLSKSRALLRLWSQRWGIESCEYSLWLALSCHRFLYSPTVAFTPLA